jgi:hypothetical protein
VEATSCAAVAGVGTAACITGPRRPAASWDPQEATTLVLVRPGATASKRRPLGPYITARFLVRRTTACLGVV